MAGKKGRSGRRPRDKEMARLAAARSRLRAALGEVANTHELALALTAETLTLWMRARAALGRSSGVEPDRDGVERVTAAARRERTLYRDLMAALRELGLTPRSATKTAAKDPAASTGTVMPWDEEPPLGEELK